MHRPKGRKKRPRPRAFDLGVEARWFPRSTATQNEFRDSAVYNPPAQLPAHGKRSWSLCSPYQCRPSTDEPRGRFIGLLPTEVVKAVRRVVNAERLDPRTLGDVLQDPRGPRWRAAYELHYREMRMQCVPDNECDRLIEAVRGVGLRLNLTTDGARVGLRDAANE